MHINRRHFEQAFRNCAWMRQNRPFQRLMAVFVRTIPTDLGPDCQVQQSFGHCSIPPQKLGVLEAPKHALGCIDWLHEELSQRIGGPGVLTTQTRNVRFAVPCMQLCTWFGRGIAMAKASDLGRSMTCGQSLGSFLAVVPATHGLLDFLSPGGLSPMSAVFTAPSFCNILCPWTYLDR